jgi:hypothetical protein
MGSVCVTKVRAGTAAELNTARDDGNMAAHTKKKRRIFIRRFRLLPSPR